MTITRAMLEALDKGDPLAPFRDEFDLPPDVLYLDGNSLGVLPKAAKARMVRAVEQEWGRGLIRSWNEAGWIDMPGRVGAAIAGLIGAHADEVIVADSTSVNIFKLAAAALRLRPGRRIILSEPGNFPTDLYMLQGLTMFLGGAVEVRTVAPADLPTALTDEVALLLLTQVHYKTGRMHDMADLTARAHAVGALTLWDLSHSAGALEVNLNGAGADFAVGCGYKYLNGGPGAPAFLFVARRHQADAVQPLSGWMGHAAPFAFDDTYRPADGMRRHLCGTPPILGLSALEEGVAIMARADRSHIREKSQRLGDLFITLVEQMCGDVFGLISPREAGQRGSHVSLSHLDGYAIMQALIARGVIGDFRAPDALRFGFTPLYLRYVDLWEAVAHLANIMQSGEYRQDRFQTKAAVT
ncbi:kynureninase [Niveispirillum lacus]|uniref:Kynureninase n=1 Tax=Niveispirillum lacus TaxID=1981099 RepID=A0A255YZ31_9PROT|nr:kynureninase [Niveispirillum lacus]OYQ34497.1 kynureninase [Niveispirillum lacus]